MLRGVFSCIDPTAARCRTAATLMSPLDGVRIVTVAVNLPGPAAAARLRSMGADVVKVEPPTGDPLAAACPDYYAQLARGQQVVTIDLKSDAGKAQALDLLASADLLLTSSRLSALAALGLDWASLHERFPTLSQVAVVGHRGADAALPGHDLTYQAEAGSLQPPELPRVLVADLAGAERAAAEGVAALFAAARTGSGVYREVALADVAVDLAAPVRHGLTGPGGFLGGGLPQYGLYRAADGYVALAAIEGHFWSALRTALQTDGTRDELEAIFRTRSAGDWQRWARENGIPLAAVRAPSAHSDKEPAA